MVVRSWLRSFLFLQLLCISTLGFAAQGPQSFTLDGYIKQAGTITALKDANLKIKIQIMDPTKHCLLYEEEQTVDTLVSEGYFSIQVGSDLGAAKRTADDSGLAMYQVFQNSTAVVAKDVPGQTCTGGMFTPITQDYRYMRVTVTPSATGVDDVLSPDTVMDAVPAAVVAEWAESVGGFTPNDLLQVNAGDNLTQTNLENLFAGTGLANLQAIAAGNFMPKSSTAGATLPSYATGTPPTTPVAGSMWYDSGTKEIKYYDGSATQIVGTSGGGSVTEVKTTTNLTVDGVAGGTITSSGTLDLNDTGVTASTYPKVTVDAKGRVTAGTTLAESDIPTLTNAGNGVDGGAIQTGTIGGNTVINTTGDITAGNITTTGTVKAAMASATATSTNQLDIYDSDNTQYVRLVAPATADLTTSYSLTLPVDDGASGQVLSTNGSGILTWATPVTSGGTGLFANGTAAAPSISFMNDPNTGVYNPSNDSNVVAISTDGAERVQFNNTGAKVTEGGIEFSNSNGKAYISNDLAEGGALLTGAGPMDDTFVIGQRSDGETFVGNYEAGSGGYSGYYSLGGYRSFFGFSYDVTDPLAAASGGTGLYVFDDHAEIYASGVSTLRVDSSVASVRAENGGPTFMIARTGTAMANGDRIGDFDFQGPSTAPYEPSARITAIASGTAGTYLPTRLAFSTTRDSTTAMSEKMTILGNGNVGVGTTSPVMKLEAAGSIKVGDGGEICAATYAGGIRYNGGNLQFCNGAAWSTLGVAGSGITALTGDVTASGTGSVAATIANDAVTSAKILDGTVATDDIAGDAVTFAKMQDISGAKLLGRSAMSAGDIQEISLGAGLKLTSGILDVSDATDDDALGGLSCAANEVPKWNGTAWVCQTTASASTSSSLVLRDGTGNFAANVVTANGLSINNAGSLVNIASPLGANYSLTLPADDGNANQVLATDGAGVLSWANALVGGGTGLFADGTAAAPSISFTNDTDTGIFRADDDEIGISTNGVERVHITNSYVGIGTTEPWGDLDVSNGTVRTGILNSTDSGSMGTLSTHNLNLMTDSGNVMTLTVDGYVGIGTTNPMADLTVRSNINGSGGGVDIKNLNAGSAAGGYVNISNDNNSASMTIKANSSGNTVSTYGPSRNTIVAAAGGLDLAAINTSSDSTIRFFTNGGTLADERMRIADTGNVGVGATDPKTKLEVAGTVKVGDGGETCGATYAGGIRYNGGALQFCNGTAWTTLGTGTGSGDFKADGTVAMTGNLKLGTNFISNDGASGKGLTFDTDGSGTVNGTNLKVSDINFGDFGLYSGIFQLNDYDHFIGSTYTPSSPLDDGTGMWTNSGSGRLRFYLYGWQVVSFDSLGNLSLDGEGQFMTGMGTVANPSYSFLSDKNTGIYSPSADSVGITTAGVERVRVNATGNVGIGTTNPGRLLEVNGPMRLTASAVPASPGTGDMYIDSGDNNKLKWYDGTAWQTAGGGGGGGSPGGATTQVQFNDGGSFAGASMLIWDKTKNYLGVGATPNYPLDVVVPNGEFNGARFKGSSWSDVIVAIESGDAYGRPVLQFTQPAATSFQILLNGDNNMIFNPGDNINSLSDDSMVFDNGGQLGLGKVPTSRLDVNGEMRLAGSTSGYVGLKGAAAAGSTTYTLPAADGTTGQFLSTNGSGVLSWQTASGGGGGSGDFKADGTVPMTGQLKAIPGNAAAPGIVIGNIADNIGFYQNGSSVLNLSMGGTEFMTFSQGTNVAALNDADFRFWTTGNRGLVWGSGDAEYIKADTSTHFLQFGTNSNERVRIDANGNVGIGTTSPANKLEVNGNIRQVAGQISSAPYDAGAATSFDLDNGNIQYTSASCTAMSLSNMQDGGTYTIVVKGTTSGTCSFTHTGLNFWYSPAQGPTAAGSMSTYTLMRVGTDVMVTWVSLYQ